MKRLSEGKREGSTAGRGPPSQYGLEGGGGEKSLSLCKGSRERGR